METWIWVTLGCTLLLVIAIWKIVPPVRRWQRKNARLDAINRHYESLRSARKDAIYHHGWANSRGDYKEAQGHEAHVEEIDRKLDLLRKQYEAVERGESENISGIVVEERLKDK
eukprot:TRINITY_DN25307_c0_g1_i1.p1 TRINITY_DN25307_c0_g1~~TRINITY_DN25307_c0_g1_i1.p1  ORF type:complete len:114 (+),score=26.80 TRINITY_DN25307_c0_g1_i1:44-385(+)